ncbi:MAG: response regulator [Anaerolineae bacterium]|nr:response regulator [Anaerolineae bacterium]
MSEGNILIIDDEPGIIRLCQRLLEKANFKVTTFTDPRKGVESFEQNQYDLLLVDIRMPGMDGFRVIDIGRQKQPDMSAVIMTGFGTLETAIRALRQGADGLILKPFEEGNELVKTVKEALKERQHKKEMARLRAIRPLLDISETLFSETRRDVLKELVLNAICGHLRCDHAAIYIRPSGESMLSLLAKKGKALPEEHARADSGLIGRADHWKVPIWVNLEGPGDEELQNILREHEMGAVICTPVARGESTIVFMAGRKINDPGFQLGDMELFGLLARQADVALENAKLYGDLREYVRQVEESQRALIQAEKMSAVGRLTASIAHEVNNPLQAVMNCLHLTKREDLDEPERKKYLDLAETEMERLMGTVQQMLDFYRPGALDRKPEDVNELINRVLALLEKQLIDNNIKVITKLSKEISPIVVVGNQVQQVFFNLIINAMNAMEDGGNLLVSTREEKGTIEIYIQDDGPGVPKELRDELFEPFMSSRDDGTGLGLSVSYGIITAHGGSLELVRGNGVGACFQVSLPIKEVQ